MEVVKKILFGLLVATLVGLLGYTLFGTSGNVEEIKQRVPFRRKFLQEVGKLCGMKVISLAVGINMVGFVGIMSEMSITIIFNTVFRSLYGMVNCNGTMVSLKH